VELSYRYTVRGGGKTVWQRKKRDQFAKLAGGKHYFPKFSFVEAISDLRVSCAFDLGRFFKASIPLAMVELSVLLSFFVALASNAASAIKSALFLVNF
jgi:hypothetical protein